MYIDIHTHQQRTSTQEVLSIYNLNVPDHHCRCGLDLEHTYYSLGIHPWKIDEHLLADNLRYIEDNAWFECVKAIGECGLDRSTHTPWDLQMQAFRAQITISEKVKKPLIIHCVKAFDDLIALKKAIKPEQAWIIHGFRGKPEQMLQLIRWGFCLSFGIQFNSESMKQLPLDHLFLETDDTGEPLNLIYNHAANVLDIPEINLIDQLEKNFAQRFN